MAFNKQAYIDFMIDNSVIGVFPEGRTLKSGRISHWYANCRSVADTVRHLQALATFVEDFTAEQNLQSDYYYGVPEGCTKTGIFCNIEKKDKTIINNIFSI